MYFHKIHDPINCSFPTHYDAATGSLRVGRHSLDIALHDFGEGVFRVRVEGATWPDQHSQAVLQPPHAASPSSARLSIGLRGGLELLAPDGARLFRSVPGQHRPPRGGVDGRQLLKLVSP